MTLGDDQAAELAAAEQDKAFNFADLLYEQGRDDGGSLDSVETATRKASPGFRLGPF